MSAKDRRGVVALVFFVLVLLFTNLGANGLLEDNEARFFDISWEMAKSGDWITPRLNHIIHFHKPPFTFWLVGGSLNLLGDSELAGRLPVALMSLAVLGMTFYWGSREKERPVSLAERITTVLILVTSLEFWFLSRLVLTDMFLAFAVMLMQISFWRLRSEESYKSWTLIFWVAFGISFLAKGPVGLAIVGLTFLGFRIMGGTIPWKRLFWIPAVLLGLALMLPWYIAVCIKYPNLFYYLFEFQTVERVATEVHGRAGPPWFYVPVILGGFFPWSFSLWASAKKAYQERSQYQLYLWAWLLFPLILFSLSGSKLPTYLLPLFPALALLTARALHDPEKQKQVAWSTVTALGLFTVALAVFLSGKVPPEVRPATNILWGAAAFSGLGFLASLALTAKGQSVTAMRAASVGFAGVLLSLTFGLGPCDEYYSAKKMGEYIHSLPQEGLVVAEFQDHLHGLPYYLNRRIVQIAYPRETLFEHDDEYKKFLFASVDEFLASLSPAQSPLIIMRKGDYAPERFGSFEEKRVGSWVVLRRP